MPALAFALFGAPLALPPVQVLLVDMGTDSITALALGAEGSEGQQMQRPPRSRHQHLLNAQLVLRAYNSIPLFSDLVRAAETTAQSRL